MIYDTRHKLVRRAMQQRLAEHEDPDLEDTIALVLEDHQALETVLMGLLSPQEIYRSNCLRVTLAISAQQPKALFPDWERFAAMLTNTDPRQRASSMQVLVNLAHADDENRVEVLLDDLLDLLDDESLPTARLMAQNAGKLALARPDLAHRVTASLLAIDATHHTPEHKALLKADALQSFGEYYAQSEDKEQILAFAQAMTESKSPKAKKAAKDFLQQRYLGKDETKG